MPTKAAKPSESDLGSAAQAIRSLLRAAHVLRTYPETNQLCQRAIEDLEPDLVPVLPLEIELDESQVWWRGTPLFQAEDLRSTLLRDLHRDGIRLIRIREGIEREELKRFVTALGSPVDPNDTNEDYVTRLWESELPHVGVTAINPYLELELPDEILEGKIRPTAEAQDVPAARIEVPPPPDDAFQTTEADREYIEEEVAQVCQRTPWENFLEALTEVCRCETQSERRSKLSTLLEIVFQRLLDDSQLEVATELIRKVRELPADAATVFREALQRMANRDRLAPLHAAVEVMSCDLEQTERLLLSLGSATADPICRFLIGSTSDQARRFYCRVLEKLGSEAVPLIVEHARNCDPGLALYFIRLLGRTRDPAAVGSLLDALDSSDRKLRREAVHSLTMIEEAKVSRTLLGIALEDADPGCRTVALRGLSHSRHRADAARLLSHIRSRRFSSLSDEEKDLVLLALGAAATDAVIPDLLGMLKPSWIPGRNRPREWRRAAAALGKVESPAAREALEKLSRSRRRPLAEACSAALSELKRGRELEGRRP
jgi:hypothetical protein